MKIEDLQDGDVVRLRMGRYVEGLDEPLWTEWHDRPLIVQRDHAGRVCSMTPKVASGWAEHDPRHEKPVGDVLVCEDYYLQIEGLE